MPASSAVPTTLKLYQVTSAPVQFATDTLKCMLVVAGSGMPATTKTGIRFVSDVTATNSEVTGTGYSRQTLTSVTVAYDGTGTTLVDFSFAAVTFSQNAAGFTNARYIVFFKDAGGADSANPVICISDPNVTLSAQTGDVVITPPTGGLIQWQ